jgi:hypothetical protein
MALRMVCFAGKQFHFVPAVPNSVGRRTRTPHKPASDDVAVPSPLETISMILQLAQHGLSSSSSIVGRNETKLASKHPMDGTATGNHRESFDDAICRLQWLAV